MDASFDSAHRFITSQGRLLEQRLFASLFLGADPRGAVDALRGYRNADGGFGHGLEPDKRCPVSLPLDVETALKAMLTAGFTDGEVVADACGFLAGVADREGTDGSVPLCLPVMEAYPRAGHMTDWTYAPALNPTAGIVGTLHAMGAENAWVSRATDACWRRLDAGEGAADAHELSETLIFLEHVPDQDRVAGQVARLTADLVAVPMLKLDPDAPGYGLTPLQLAPHARSPWRRLFEPGQIDAHLDALAAAQEADGGWPISWQPPSDASVLEWRGIVTLEAVRTLTSYGRMSSPV